MWRVLEVTHTRTLHTLTLKQPNSEIENKCDKRDTERWKREGGRKEGRGIRERAADVKIVWREIRKHARKQNQKRKKGKLYWNINQQYLLFCFMLHVWQINECVCACGCAFTWIVLCAFSYRSSEPFAFKLDYSLQHRDERREDRINLSGHWLRLNLLSGLINIHAPIHSLCDSHLFYIESWPSIYIHWRLPMLAFFQTVVTSDSVGASVIAQHEHLTCDTLLSLQCSQKNEGEFTSKGNGESKIHLKSSWTFFSAGTTQIY